MGMFSMGECVEVREVDETRRDRESKWAPMPPLTTEQEISNALKKLTRREVDLVFHYSLETRVELVRELCPDDAEYIEHLMNRHARKVNARTLEEQEELALKAAGRAFATTVQMAREGKFSK